MGTFVIGFLVTVASAALLAFGVRARGRTLCNGCRTASHCAEATTAGHAGEGEV